MTPQHLSHLSMAILLACGTLLSACSKSDDKLSAGQKLDAAVADAKAEGEALKADAQQAGNKAQAKASEVNTAISDTAIVAAVHVRLAQDKDLETSKIDVVVDKGHVTLKGSAPSEAAMGRAVSLAKGTAGVVSVDSLLRMAAN